MSEFKKKTEKAEEISRKIWLAGLGVYGQRLESLQGGYEKMSDQARDYFEELVARGEKLEKDTKYGFKSQRDKLKARTEKQKDVVHRQLSELKEKVSAIDKNELLDELQAGVTRLTETFNRLVEGSGSKAAAKKAPVPATTTRKPAARKTTGKAAGTTARTGKAASAKTAAKKTTAAKTTAAKPRGRKPAAPKASPQN